MENQSLLSYNNQLSNRVLWADGSTSLDKQQLYEYFLSGNSSLEKIFIEEMDSEIERFNLETGNNLKVKYNNDLSTTEWNIPEEYKLMDVDAFVCKKLSRYIKKNPELKESAIERVASELERFKNEDKMELIKVVTFIVEKMKSMNLVWGVGRGSSCACFIFYLIGLHSVDCIRYDVSLDEFFR